MTTNESVEPELPPETADPRPEAEDATYSPRPRRRTRLTVTLAVALLAIGVTVVAFATGGHNARDTSPGGQAAPPKAMTSPGKTTAGADRSPAGTPSAGPSDAWQGFGVLSDTDPAVMMRQLTGRWGLVFEKEPGGTGTTEMGLTGDMTRKGRRLDGAVTFDADNRIRSVLCQAGGTEVSLVADEVNQQFLYDCLAQAIHGTEWTSLKAWLDEHIAQLRTGGHGNYRSTAIRLEMHSDGHFMRVAAAGN